MIHKLKIKFITTIMVMVGIVLLLAIFTIHYLNYSYSRMQGAAILTDMTQNFGKESGQDTFSSGFAMLIPQDDAEFERSITLKLDKNLNIIEVHCPNGQTELSNSWMTIVENILQDETESGIKDGYQYLLTETEDGYIMAVSDQRIHTVMYQRMLILSIIILLGSLIFLFVIAIYLTNLMIKPVEDSFKKQKQFISDASHELKTPLSVITVNADVLESKIGKNAYLSFIQTEVERMNRLVNDLLILAKIDGVKDTSSFSVINLSKIVESVVLSFESIAYEAGKQYEVEIEKDILFYGDAQKISQVLSILIDNAIKYAEENGLIRITLKKDMKEHGRGRITVFNTGKGIRDIEKNKIFQRFYRLDESRSKETGGYGLGLAIAKAIIDEHKGKIWVEGEEKKWVSFEILL